MKIYKITEASNYLGVSINTLKTLANNGKIKSFKTTGEHRRFRQEDLDAYMGVEKEQKEKLTVIYARCSTAKQKENLERQKDRLRKHAEAKGGFRCIGAALAHRQRASGAGAAPDLLGVQDAAGARRRELAGGAHGRSD